MGNTLLQEARLCTIYSIDCMATIESSVWPELFRKILRASSTTELRTFHQWENVFLTRAMLRAHEETSMVFFLEQLGPPAALGRFMGREKSAGSATHCTSCNRPEQNARIAIRLRRPYLSIPVSVCVDRYEDSPKGTSHEERIIRRNTDRIRRSQKHAAGTRMNPCSESPALRPMNYEYGWPQQGGASLAKQEVQLIVEHTSRTICTSIDP